ncbi:acyl-CoA dehydrogenase family protein [Nocardioides immobilis]|nr:acyl-CoA dehydrogenase family protein [Nocardioides immobilis]
MEDMEQDLRDSLRALMGSRSFLDAETLFDSGWDEVLEESPRLAVRTLFEEAGRGAVATAGLDVLISLALAPEREVLRVLAVQSRSLEGVDEDGVVMVERAVVTTDPDVVVIVDRRGADVVGAAEVEPGTGWTVEQVAGADTDSRLRLLSGRGRIRRRLSAPETEAMDRMVLLALSHERCGAARGLLDVAVGHVRERHQFGVPIGSLQAVQHRLAGVEVAVEAALSSLDAAWDTDDEVATLVAVAASARALSEAVRDCLQVCGGMGFTDEFPLARLMRRAVVLEGSGPSTRDAETAIGRRLVESGVVRIGEIDRPTEGQA